MSLSKTASRALIIGFAVMLGACGFKPLYGPRGTNTDAGANIKTEDYLALVRIGPIKDRLGQMMHNELLERLSPKGRPVHPRYTLTVTVTESIGSLGVQKSGDATRANLNLTASYALGALSAEQGGAPVTLASGSLRAVSSYDISSAEFATLSASRNARINAVREVADDIRTRIAVYFSQNAPLAEQ